MFFSDPYDPAVQLVLLNTCGFISSGREEMFHTLEKLLAHGKKVCLIGCAVQYFQRLCVDKPPLVSTRTPLSRGSATKAEFRDTQAQVTVPLDKGEGGPRSLVRGTEGGLHTEHKKRRALLTNPNISLLSRNDLKNASIPQLLEGFQSQTFHDFERLNTPRALTNLPHKYEYLKIAEGCNNSCSFCIIPKIRGKQTSLPIPNILHEVQNLVHQGAEEIILIAQDSTRYGTDLYGKAQLFELLEQIEQLP